MTYQQLLGNNNTLTAADIAAGATATGVLSNRRRAAIAASTMVARIFQSISTTTPPLGAYDVELPTEFLKAHATVNWIGGRGDITISADEFAHAKSQWDNNKKDTCILYFNANTANALYSAMTEVVFVGGIRYSEYVVHAVQTPKGEFKVPQKYLHSV